jgi:acyl-coenzyme A thioesterase PaaI-like protein
MSVEELLARDRFAAAMGVRLVEAGPDRVVVEMDIAVHHREADGGVATGALFSLADCAMSLISNADGTAVAVATHFTRRERGEAARVARADIRPALPPGEREVTWSAVVTADDRRVGSFTGTTLRVGNR